MEADISSPIEATLKASIVKVSNGQIQPRHIDEVEDSLRDLAINSMMVISLLSHLEEELNVRFDIADLVEKQVLDSKRRFVDYIQLLIGHADQEEGTI